MLCKTYAVLRLRRKLGPGMIHHRLLVPDIIDTLLAHRRLRPALEPGCFFLQRRQEFRAEQAVLRLSKGQDAEEEGAG